MRVRVHFESLRHEVRTQDEDFLELCCVELEVEKVRLPEIFREIVASPIPRAIGGGVAGRCKREGRLRENLIEDTMGKWG